MGEIVQAAKCTHEPTILMSELEGPTKGTRQPSINGHTEIAGRAKALGADTVVICDTHWVINAGFHINANSRFHGLFTSNEFPQFIQHLEYDYQGNPELGDAIAKTASDMRVYTLSHHLYLLEPEYGSLLPTRFMSREHEMEVFGIAAWCTVHDHATFLNMPLENTEFCCGEGSIHDTAMLNGAFGWDAYDKPCEVVTDYFPSSGTGQTNVIFPV